MVSQGTIMSKASKKFEQQIARIHQLLEQTEAEVTWNDRIPDPDNPRQPRQIDITIRNLGHLTLVECRIHSKKQDVKWIEEMMGRRISLKADAIIAVSASGFTSGAIKKAKRQGVILRDMISLTEDEIRRWGKPTKICIRYFKFNAPRMAFIFDSGHENEINTDDLHSYLQSNVHIVDGMLQQAADNIAAKYPTALAGEVRVKFDIKKPISINNLTVAEIWFSAKLEIEPVELETASIVAYDNPGIDALNRNTYIELVKLGQFEVRRSRQLASITIDCSAIVPPENCVVKSIDFEFGVPVNIKTYEMVGPPNFPLTLSHLILDIGFRTQGCNTRTES